MPNVEIAGRYTLIRLLGAGGMGAVHEAEHVVTRRRVALKMLHANRVWTEETIGRFIGEAQIAAAIGHPNIIDVLDAGVDGDGSPFIVFEYLKGSSISALIESGPIPIDRALSIITDVLDALTAAHGRGVLHRDIKPDNVFLAVDAKGNTAVKLLDFGIARAAAELDVAPRPHTATGMAMGTPAYMSPEQVRGQRDIDARTDVWSVGVMLYEMLAGVLPFPPTETPFSTLLAITVNPHIPLVQVAPSLPPSVIAIVEAALQKDRDLRTASSTEMLAQVQRVRVELGLSPRSSVVPIAPLPSVDIANMPTQEGPVARYASRASDPPTSPLSRLRRVGWAISAVIAVLAIVLVVGLKAAAPRVAPPTHRSTSEGQTVVTLPRIASTAVTATSDASARAEPVTAAMVEPTTTEPPSARPGRLTRLHRSARSDAAVPGVELPARIAPHTRNRMGISTPTGCARRAPLGRDRAAPPESPERLLREAISPSLRASSRLHRATPQRYHCRAGKAPESGPGPTAEAVHAMDVAARTAAEASLTMHPIGTEVHQPAVLRQCAPPCAPRAYRRTATDVELARDRQNLARLDTRSRHPNPLLAARCPRPVARCPWLAPPQFVACIVLFVARCHAVLWLANGWPMCRRRERRAGSARARVAVRTIGLLDPF